MAGMVCTITEEKWGNPHKIKFDWLSDNAAGTAQGTTTNAYSGSLHAVYFKPDGAALQPDNLYDVTLEDEDGNDVLLGAGANLSNAATVMKKAADLGMVKADKLTLKVSGANNAKAGEVYIFIEAMD